MATVKELTGGTGDVNPQIMHLALTQTGADVFTDVEVSLPLPRFPQKGNRSIVLEVIAVTTIPNNLLLPIGAGNAIEYHIATAGTPNANNSRNFYTRFIEFPLATAVGFQFFEAAKRTELHDGAGHGFLVATDSIIFGLGSTTTAVAQKVFFKVEYRFKEVSLAEYIGIVQSQQ